MNKDAQGRWKVGMSNIKLKMRGEWVLIPGSEWDEDRLEGKADSRHLGRDIQRQDCFKHNLALGARDPNLLIPFEFRDSVSAE